MIVLGIETSCDETAASICKDGVILSSQIGSQSIHQLYGGVVPELASREHELWLNTLVDQAIQQAGISLDEIDGIAVTQGPGLAGALLTGVCFAKGLSQSLQRPIIGVNHLEAHIFANFLADPTLDYPFVCLLVSGGHTQLWLVKKIGEYELMGETCDDAAGEAFDKGARVLGLGYPGGPAIQKYAVGGNPSAVKFPRSFMKKDSFEFSFSGLKTSLLYYMDDFDEETSTITKKDVTASYQMAIVDVLSEKIANAVTFSDVNTCVIAGGVAANQLLRDTIKSKLPDARVIFPDLCYCTDNAAMVAFIGELKLKAGQTSPLDFRIKPNLKLA